jgi:hypothetical protein
LLAESSGKLFTPFCVRVTVANISCSDGLDLANMRIAVAPISMVIGLSEYSVYIGANIVSRVRPSELSSKNAAIAVENKKAETLVRRSLSPSLTSTVNAAIALWSSGIERIRTVSGFARILHVSPYFAYCVAWPA